MARHAKKPSKKRLAFGPPSHERQVAFHQLMIAARKTSLLEALQEALKVVEQTAVKRELGTLVPVDVQQILAGAGIRDEFVFPCPTILTAMPSLVGYYRRLLGVPQKGFYGKNGMGRFKSMELQGNISVRQTGELEAFCEAMAWSLAELIRGIQPALTQKDLNDLPLLTLGAQLQGSNNNAIGQQATREVFLAIKQILAQECVIEAERLIGFTNAAGRSVEIRLGADPDIGIWEKFGSKWRPIVAIEIKGGSDRSNAHNRAGEAEKSHQKARKSGFRDFWTIITTAGLEPALQVESPTTTSWFDVTQVLARKGENWKEFQSRLSGALGIRDSSTNSGAAK